MDELGRTPADDRGPSREAMSSIVKAVRAFGHFWLDFLVGDTPEIFLGTLAVVAAALIFRHDRAVGITLLLVLTVLLLVVSTYRGRKRGSVPKGEEGQSAPPA
jgi:uncharacterized membrane protein (UPF0136 family)